MLCVGAPVLDPIAAEEVDVVLHLRAKSLTGCDEALALVPARRNCRGGRQDLDLCEYAVRVGAPIATVSVVHVAEIKEGIAWVVG